MMWDACAAKIRAMGGEVVDGPSGDQPRVGCVDAAVDGGHPRRRPARRFTYAARHVISSAPMRELVQSISPTAAPYCRRRSI